MSNVVITGAADGIGRALAAQAIQRGATVLGIDVDASRASKTESALGENISFVLADLTDAHGITQAAQAIIEFGPVDVLVHNAGISEVGYFQNTDLGRQQQVISLNLLTPMLLTKMLLAEDALTESASVVFLSSLSRYVSYPGASVYAARKTASPLMPVRYASPTRNMHALTVYPGPTRTAHARRYSPDNAREDSRMPPDALAAHIWDAVDSRQPVLIPGMANKAFAALGRWFPWLTNWMMRKTLLEKFDA